MSAVPSGRFSRLRTENPIDRFTIGKSRPQSGFQTADAEILSIGKVRPQYSYITDSGLPGCIGIVTVCMGRSADSRPPSEAGAPPRVRPLTGPSIDGCIDGAFEGASVHPWMHPNMNGRYCQRAAQRRQARQGECACTQGARRTLSRRSPCSCEPGSDPCPSSCAHHQQHAEQIDRLRARERATGGAQREFGADAHGDGGRSNSRQRRSNQRRAHACTARWRRCFSSRCFRVSTGKPAPASTPAALRPRILPVFGKYLSPSRRHAGTTGPINHRVWETKKPGLVKFGGCL